ncbi:MAG: HEAT repeat domain-containing protein [Actinobacteria bacterium]|nr:HEAT repeat domain-containing protein [Actinomycetota bacterium]
MGVILFYLLLLIVIALAATAFYLLVRIIGIYRRARRLETMRNYETILYAALPKLSPEEAMRSLLPEPDEVALEEVLLRMGDEAEGEWKEKVIQVYRTRGYAEKRLRQLRSRSKSRRSQAARRLGRIGDPEAVAPLKELLTDPREEVREAALFALGRMGTLPALKAMCEVLGASDRWAWEKVAEAMEEMGDECHLVLCELLRDENAACRAFAAEVAGTVGGNEEASLLEEALRDPEVDVRARAASSLGRLRHHVSRPALREALRDEAWEVRCQAAKALGLLGNGEDATALAAALRDASWWVRQNAAAALQELGEAGERALQEALWDGDRFARETAAQALEEAGLVEMAATEMREGNLDLDRGRAVRRMAEMGRVGCIADFILRSRERSVVAGFLSLLEGVEHPLLDTVRKKVAGFAASQGNGDGAGKGERGEGQPEEPGREEAGREGARGDQPGREETGGKVP